MDIEKLNIQEIPEDGIIKIYTAQGLNEKEQKKADDISGAIHTVYEYLQKRHMYNGLDKEQTHVKFSYEKHEIVLVLNEYDHYSPVITGRMIATDVLQKLQINTGHGWSTHTLAQFFRLNRNIFQDKNVCAELITQLNNFEVKVKKQIEAKTDDRANYELAKRQVVESNIPESFRLEVPVFKGLGKIMIEVEVDISPESFQCILISPDLSDYIEQCAESAIDAELELIEELCPELPVIEI